MGLQIIESRSTIDEPIKQFHMIHCRCITSLGVQHLEIHQGSLIELDLSGCYRVDGETLTMFVRECTKLKPQKVNLISNRESILMG